mgnify:CR=1 FL=1
MFTEKSAQAMHRRMQERAAQSAERAGKMSETEWEHMEDVDPAPCIKCGDLHDPFTMSSTVDGYLCLSCDPDIGDGALERQRASMAIQTWAASIGLNLLSLPYTFGILHWLYVNQGVAEAGPFWSGYSVMAALAFALAVYCLPLGFRARDTARSLDRDEKRSLPWAALFCLGSSLFWLAALTGMCMGSPILL